MRNVWILCAALALLVGCDRKGTTDEKQGEATERMVAEANRQVGMPGITNYTERKFAKQILELRDSELTTYTYIVDFNGRLHFVCNSIGYGLPYSVQFTNPERVAYPSYAGRLTVPQPDPNGLFMPDGLSATWILCSDGKGGVSPVYSEPALLVSPFKLNVTGETYTATD